MSQNRQSKSTRAVDALNDSNPKSLADNMTIVKREDGAVILTTTASHGLKKDADGKMVPRFRTMSRRCDSAGDQDHVAKGGKTWWTKLLTEQKVRDAKAEKKATAKKGD